jgi:hypothetical protein
MKVSFCGGVPTEILPNHLEHASASDWSWACIDVLKVGTLEKVSQRESGGFDPSPVDSARGRDYFSSRQANCCGIGSSANINRQGKQSKRKSI